MSGFQWGRLAPVVILFLLGCSGEKHVVPGPKGPAAVGSGYAPGAEVAAKCATDAGCVGLVGGGPCAAPRCDPVMRTCVSIALPEGAGCDDGDACTQNGQCAGGQCVGTPTSCNDGNPCTDDLCDPVSGGCQAQPNAAPCDDGQLCTLNDVCSGGACTGQVNPKCQCEQDVDCAQFDDADLCNGVLGCIGNECVAKPGSAVHCDQIENTPCRTNVCVPETGECQLSSLSDGQACDDGTACSVKDACKAGSCVGTALNCDDGNQCTDDSCDSGSGCVHIATSAGCDDGDLCTVDDTCIGGACHGTVNPGCGCVKNADCFPFEDGDLCNGTLSCQAGQCAVEPASVVSCGDGAGPCVTVSCTAATGQCEAKPALDGSVCDDGSACTTADHCAAGGCVGSDVACDDGEHCTDDGCDAATGCFHAPNSKACDDGKDCTADDACSGGQCVGQGECQCTVDAECAAFEDGDLCNGTLVCQGGTCGVAPGSVVTCVGQASGPCRAIACIPATGQCKEQPIEMDGAACDDGSKCTGPQDFCEAGVCAGKGIVCDDNNLCTNDACDAAIGCVFTYNAGGCDDGNPCTESDSCKAGQCTGAQTQQCACSSSADCAQYEDGDLCNGSLVCSGNKCVVDPTSVVTCPGADGTGCAIGECVPATGLCDVFVAPSGKPCDDGDACTLGDACDAGSCLASSTAACEDGNPCTDAGCAPDFGCVYQPNEGPCDDGDVATTDDHCFNGYCNPGEHPAGGCPTNCQAQWALPCGFYHTHHTAGAGATVAQKFYGGCSDEAYDGGEYAYYFEAPYDGAMTVTLENETAVTDVFIVSADDGCFTHNCLATGSASASAEMVKGERYYFVVDGKWGEYGDYTISLACTPVVEQACGDGKDDDGDGKVDCEDGDCAGSAKCQTATCAPMWELGCGASDVWATTLYGATDAVETWSGCGEDGDYPGPEYTYVFEAAASGTVTVSLSDESADTDVLVLLAGSGDACDSGAACVASGMAKASFEATAGQRYLIVVDGYGGEAGQFRLDVDCGW